MPNRITAGQGLFGKLDVSKDGGLSIGGTAVTATAAQLNAVTYLTSPSVQLDYLDVTPGTLAIGSAVVVDANGKIDTLDITAPKINGTSVSATAAELNRLADVTPGTLAIGSAVVVDADGKIDTIDVTSLKLGGVAVTSSAAELNILDGASCTAANLNTLKVTAGTLAVGSVVAVDASGKINTIDITTLLINGGTVTASAAEINVLAGHSVSTDQFATLDVVPGTLTAGSAVVVDASSKINTMDITMLYLDGGIVRPTATELNCLASVTPGTLAIGSAVVVDASGKINTLDITTPLFNGATVTSTAAELNKLAGSGTIVNHVQSEITYTGSAATNLFQLPANAVPISFDVFVTTAFNDTGSDYLSIGKTGTAGFFVTNADVSATGRVNITTQATNWLTSVGGAQITVIGTYTGGSADPTDGTAIVSCLYKLS